MSKHRSEFTIWTKGENRHLIRVELPLDPESGKRRRASRMVHGTRAAAKNIARQMLMERDHGIDLSPRKITVSDWFSSWLNRHHGEGHLGDRVYERYQGILRSHVFPQVGHVLLGELRSDNIAELKDRWLTGRSSTSSTPLSPATVYKHLNVVRKALDAAVAAHIIQISPAASVSSPSLKKRDEQRALDADEIRVLVEACCGTRYDVAVRFAIATGLRQAELLSLRWKDIDHDRGLLYCLGSKSKNSRRAIELSPETIRLLRIHKADQLGRRLMLGPLWQDSGLVFPSSIGTPWARRIFYRDYKKVVSKSDITDPESVHWHTLRHTAASQWILHGVDIFTVSRRLGHASASFTMDTYGHLLKGQQTEAARALDHLVALR